MIFSSLQRALLLLLMLSSSSVMAEIVVHDDLGHELRLQQPAQRIVSLAPHLTELLFAAGAGEQIVGVVAYSNYPAAAQQIEQVGGYTALDLERIALLKPDLVVAWTGGNREGHLERLEQLGIPLFQHRPTRLGDIPSIIERLGLLTGQQRVASAQAEQLRDRIERLREQNRGATEVTLFYQIWDRPLMTIGGGQIISEVITLCGGKNIFADLAVAAAPVSEEAVVAADPQVIIASGMGEARPEWLDSWRRWEQLRAVRGEGLFYIDPDLLQRAGPRLVEGAEQLCGLLTQIRVQRSGE